MAENTDMIQVDTSQLATTDPQEIFNQVAALKVFYSSLTEDTTENKVKTVNAFNNAQSLKDFEGVVLDVCDVIQTSGVRKGRNGMPDSPCVNTYLLTSDGAAYYSQSDGVAKSAQMIASAFPGFDCDGTGCVQVVMVNTQLPNGNDYKKLTIVA